jgi:hypothetical protein
VASSASLATLLRKFRHHHIAASKSIFLPTAPSSHPWLSLLTPGSRPTSPALNSPKCHGSSPPIYFHFHPIHQLCRFRQTDEEFIQHLDSLRSGDLTPQVSQFFRDLERPLPRRNDGLLPTKLVVTNAAAADINNNELHKLNGPIQRFSCLDGDQRSADDPFVPPSPPHLHEPSSPESQKPKSQRTITPHERACQSYLEVCPAEQEIQLAIGAQVHYPLAASKVSD